MEALRAIIEQSPAVGLIVLLLVFQWISYARDWQITGPAHRREIAAKDELITFHRERGDGYKAAGEKKDETIRLLAHSNAEWARAGRTVDKFFTNVVPSGDDTESELPDGNHQR